MERVGRTIDMYIFKNPKFKEEIKLIEEEVMKKYGNRLEIFNFDFNCKDSKVGYVWISTYLSPTESTPELDPIEIEELFFTIYKDFFPNEVAYLNSEGELEGGYQNVFYYENERHYFDTMDNIAYDIKKIFRNYNELRKQL